MCKNCKASGLGIQRQAELDAARAECERLNINVDTAGFIIRYARSRVVPRDEHPQAQAAVERYNVAFAAMKKLHEDYVWELARKSMQEARERGVKPLSITHSDPQKGA